MFERAKVPEDLSVSSRGLLNFLDAIEQKKLEIHSLKLLRHGKIACEMNFKPYDADTPHMLFSLSKSFCSCACGFAVSEGLLRFEDRVLDILPDKAPANPSEWMRQLTLADLLCMGSGLDPASDGGSSKKDWCKAVLAHEIQYKPGTHFHYNSMNTYLASAMVQRVTGMTVRDYLMPRLFDKIGIEKPEWDSCPMGINFGGWGLNLSCADIARFGQLLLNHGMWNGERVLPEGWVEHATSKKIDNFAGDANSDWQQGYCQQFWRTRGGRYRGDGMFGQICMVDEKNDAVIAITAGLENMGAEMDAIDAHIIPALTAEPADEQTQRALAARLSTLAYPFPASDGTEADVFGAFRAQDGQTVKITKNGEKITIALSRIGDDPAARTIFTQGKPFRGRVRTGFGSRTSREYLAQYGFEKGALHAVARVPGAPFVCDVTVTAIEGGIRMVNVGNGMDKTPKDYMKATE